MGKYFSASFLYLILENIIYIGLSWYLVQQFESPLLIGVFNFFRLLPIGFVCFFVFRYAHFFNKKNLIHISYIGNAVFSIALFLYFTTHQGNWPLFFLIVFMRGLFFELEPPLRYALIPDWVSPSAVPHSTANYTALINISGILAPLILTFFWHDQIFQSYFLLVHGFICLLLLSSLLQIPSRTPSTNSFKETNENIVLRLTWNELKTRRHTLLLCICLGYLFMFFIQSFIGFIPIYVLDYFGKDNSHYTMFLTLFYTGSLLSTLVSRFLAKQLSLTIIFMLGFITAVILLGINTFPPHIFASSLFFFLGFCMQITRTMSRIYVQTRAPNSHRPQWMSLSLLDRGFVPFGAMVLGFLMIYMPMPQAVIIFVTMFILAGILLLGFQKTKGKSHEKIDV